MPPQSVFCKNCLVPVVPVNGKCPHCNSSLDMTKQESPIAKLEDLIAVEPETRHSDLDERYMDKDTRNKPSGARYTSDGRKILLDLGLFKICEDD